MKGDDALWPSPSSMLLFFPVLHLIEGAGRGTVSERDAEESVGFRVVPAEGGTWEQAWGGLLRKADSGM